MSSGGNFSVVRDAQQGRTYENCNWQHRAGVVLWATMSVGSAAAIEPYQEYRKHVESAQNLTVLKDDLFGEAVNLYTGKTEFAVTDIQFDRKQRAAGAVETPLQC